MSGVQPPIFVDAVPSIEVKNDHFYVTGSVGSVWTSAAFRDFVEAARLALLAYDDAKRNVVRLRHGRGKGVHAA